MRFAALLVPLLLTACSLPGGFPSLQPRPEETPRVLAAPDAGQVPALSPEERQSLAADLTRERRSLAALQQAIAREGAALDRQLARKGANTRGSAAWSDAQMQLSRFDVARQPLDDLRARLSPLQLLVDSLAATDPDRRAVESLVAAVEQLATATKQRLDDGVRRLGA